MPKTETYLLENTPERIKLRYEGLVAYAQNHDFGVLDEDVVVVDTETTGFSFNHDELIQIAAARMKKGQITEWFITFVNPGQPIPDDVAHLTNISDDDVKNAPTPDQALQELVHFVGDSYLVAHNAHFDRTFITKRESGASLKNNIWVDSLDLARIALPRMSSHRLLDLVRAFGGPDSTHRADEDVAATCLVYRVLLAAVQNMPVELVKCIADMMSVDEWNTAFVFKTLAPSDAAAYNFRASRRSQVAQLESTKRVDIFKPEISPSARDASISGQNSQNAENFLQETSTPLSSELSNISGTPEELSNEPLASQIDDELLERLAHLEFATAAEIEEAFSAHGLLSVCYEQYEPREEQKTMAQAVNQALSQSSNLAVEAGTGVGKSMAYLLPMALAAQKNQMTVGVATKTNSLLDQLITKELPLLREQLGITYAPLKGFSHYLCNRKIEQLVVSKPAVIMYKNQMVNQAPALAALLSYVEQSDYDDMDGLKIDYRAYPKYRISTKSTECLRKKCPYYAKACFVHGAREQAQCCDIVVTNHSLLFWDARFDGGLLPPVHYWVVDEAHSAEADARKAFSVTVSCETMQKLAQKMTSTSARTNVFQRAKRLIDIEEGEAKTLFDSMILKAQVKAGAFDIAAQEFCLAAKDLLMFAPRSKKTSYEYFDLWLNHEIRTSDTFAGVKTAAKSLYQTTEQCITEVRNIVVYLESLDLSSSGQRELAYAALELKELYDGLEEIFFKESDNKVYSVRLSQTKTNLNELFTAQPLDMGSSLNETLYQNTNSIIYTSATLSVDGAFDSFERAVGLNQSEDSQAKTLQVASSYDFDSQMTVYVPSDMPDPSDTHYLEALQSLLVDLHVAQEGSLLTLFTNRREMERCFDVVNPQLKSYNLRLVCQKWGVSVKGLRDDFLKDEHLSLFALKSFWAGFDAPGSTLRGVVIPKLPFGLPTDPLSCERRERDSQAWSHYALPEAVIEVKQAVGRLIRSSTDEGVVVLADSRLITKYYGKKFLNSLPSKTIKIMPSADIVADIKARYAHG